MRLLIRLIVAFGVAAIVVAYFGSSRGSKQETAPPSREVATSIVARAEMVLREWQEFGTKKLKAAPTRERTKSAIDNLSLITVDEPERERAQDILKRLQETSKKYQNAALEAEAVALSMKLLEGRKAYAARLEDAYLKKGQDFRIRTEGKDATTLRIQWVLIGRPFVYNAVNDTNLMSTWRLMGFKTVIFSDGYNNTWRQPVH